MKKILSILTVFAIVFAVSSCGNKKAKVKVDTHTHEDGTVHADDAHAHDATAKPAQESFEVKEDNDAEHKHKTSEHTHDDGTVHTDHK